MTSKILWKLFAAFFLVSVLSLLLLYSQLVPRLRGFLTEQIEISLKDKALLIRERLDVAPSEAWKGFALDPLIDELAGEIHTRVTVINEEGMVLADSELDGETLTSVENHLNRPEVQASLRNDYGVEIRYSTTLGIDQMYVAVKARGGGFARVSLPLRTIAGVIGHVRNAVIVSVLLALLLASVAGFVVSRNAGRVLGEVMQAADAMSRGDFSKKISLKRRDELGRVAQAINDTSAALQADRFQLEHERNQLRAVLDAIIEGVLVADARGIVMLSNPSLSRIFALSFPPEGQTLLECFRSGDLDDSIRSARGRNQPVTLELPFFVDGEEHFLIVQTAPLIRGNAEKWTVSVFHDITERRKLENIRKEFVANVSHELKTPLTNIRGYAETLKTGALTDVSTASRFIEKIETNALHLQELVEDILQLSEIESGRFQVNPEPTDFKKLTSPLFEEYTERARGSGIRFSGRIAGEMGPATLDTRSFVRVLDNLVDNALRYTESGGEVIVEMGLTEDRLHVSVTDTGIGISASDLARIFERFYRVDKSRTRGSGGTGLGLAIVKHLLQLMGGEIAAESEPGKGSRFFFTLPLIPSSFS